MKLTLTHLQCMTIWEKYFSNDTAGLFAIKRMIKNKSFNHDNSSIIAYDGENFIELKKCNYFNALQIIKAEMTNFVIFNNQNKQFEAYQGDYLKQGQFIQWKISTLQSYLNKSLEVKLINKWQRKAKERLVSYNKKYNNRKECVEIITLWDRAFKDQLVPLYQYRVNEAGEREYLFSQYTIKDLDGCVYITQAQYVV